MRIKRILAVLALASSAIVTCAAAAPDATQRGAASADKIRGEEHWVTRDGLKIYLWEKRADPNRRHAQGVILLVHGGTWSGRPDFDLQIRDYSLMDFLATHGFDVWAIDIHGYGHSDKTDKDWSEPGSAAADLATAADYITRASGFTVIDVLGWSAGTQRVGLFAMLHPEKVRRLVLYAPHWKGTSEYQAAVKKRIENGGVPLTQFRVNTEADARSDFVRGDLAQDPQFEEDVVRMYAAEALKTDPRSPNAFVANATGPILDPLRITVPTLIIHGERDYAAQQEDLLPFFQALKTNDKSYVLLPGGGHAIMLEKQHRMFQHEILSFLERP